MKTLRTILAVAAIACVASPVMAANIGVYFDEAATSTSTTVEINTIFEIYIVMSDVNDTVDAVEYKKVLPPGLIVVANDFWGDNSINIGNATDGEVVGLGECVAVFDVLPGNEMMVVETIFARALAPIVNFTLDLGPYTGPSGGSVPRYSDCDSNVLDMTVSTASLSTAVPTFKESFGAVKALYQD